MDGLKEKEMNDPRIQAIFKRSRHSRVCIFIINQDYYELPKETIRANVNIYYIFKPNNYRNVQNLYQDKTSMDMTLNEFKLLTSTCWNEKYQPLVIVTSNEKYTGLYRFELNSIFFPDANPFYHL